jgi:hypothetical protein
VTAFTRASVCYSSHSSSPVVARLLLPCRWRWCRTRSHTVGLALEEGEHLGSRDVTGGVVGRLTCPAPKAGPAAVRTRIPEVRLASSASHVNNLQLHQAFHLPDGQAACSLVPPDGPRSRPLAPHVQRRSTWTQAPARWWSPPRPNTLRGLPFSFPLCPPLPTTRSRQGKAGAAA